MWISPKYQETDFTWHLSLKDKITVFEDRVLGWQLEVADKIINGKKDQKGETFQGPIRDSGFAVLFITLSYFEMIAKCQNGFNKGGSSKIYFNKGVKDVFHELQGNVEVLLDVLYSEVRCGLYHRGQMGPNVSLSAEYQLAIDSDEQDKRLLINPHRLIPALIAHFELYIQELRNPSNHQLRSNFEKWFDYEEN